MERCRVEVESDAPELAILAALECEADLPSASAVVSAWTPIAPDPVENSEMVFPSL